MSNNSLYRSEEDKTVDNKFYNRRERLTLRKLSKLRKIREARKLQLMMDYQLSAIMFGSQPDER